eukprot:m.232317 g.232317  ORF g.232317 m.232317 type:complete len:76 (+) comp54280_c0_seq65:45-272(+)
MLRCCAAWRTPRQLKIIFKVLNQSLASAVHSLVCGFVPVTQLAPDGSLGKLHSEIAQQEDIGRSRPEDAASHTTN